MQACIRTMDRDSRLRCEKDDEADVSHDQARLMVPRISYFYIMTFHGFWNEVLSET